MKHNYKLSDFKKMQPEEMEVNILERLVSIDIVDLAKVPEIIKNRFTTLVNRAIDDYEQSNNTVIPLDDMEISMQIEVDTQEKEFFLQDYIGYSIDANCLYGKDIIGSDDEDYEVIKEYFLNRLTESVSEQVIKISACV